MMRRRTRFSSMHSTAASGSLTTYRPPEWRRPWKRPVVPWVMSRCSTRMASNPLITRSRRTPVPVAPPPITSTSVWCLCIRATLGEWLGLCTWLSEDHREESPGPLVLGVGEYVLGRPFLDDHPSVHEHDPVGDLPGEPHLVGDDHHRHPVLGEATHHVEDLPDQLGVEGGGRLVEEHHVRLHRQRPGDGHPLLLAPRQPVRVLV